MSKIKYINLCINFLIFSIVLINKSKIIFNIKYLIFYLKSHKEFKNIEQFLELCNNNTYKIIEKFEKTKIQIYLLYLLFLIVKDIF